MLEIIFNHLYVTLTVAFTAYWTCLATYRLVFSPVSKFPGPRLAALTYLYEFWYDRLTTGRFAFHIQELHKQYGPVVRISPHEIHINDASFIPILYTTANKGRRDKDTFHLPPDHTKSTFDSIDHDTHRMRRSVLSRHFSRAYVNRVEDMLRATADRMITKLESYTGRGPIDLADPFRCIASDVVWQYSLGYDPQYLEHKDFKPSLAADIMMLVFVVPILRQLPFLTKLRHLTSDRFVGKLVPKTSSILGWRNSVRTVVTRVDKELRGPTDIKLDLQHPTVFHELLQAEELPPAEKEIDRMVEEAESLLGAGSVTTAWALTVTVGHLLLPSSQPIFSRISKELEQLMPNSGDECPAWAQLEQKAPCLSAAVAEGLRLALGTGVRLARIAPDEPLRFVPRDAKGRGDEVVIPPGVCVSMTALAVHHDESIFPDSFHFRPERWLDENGRRRHDLDSYLLTFGKGARACVGINLAYAELFIITATLIRRLGNSMELYETNQTDVLPGRIFNTPAPKIDSKGLRVIIKPRS